MGAGQSARRLTIDNEDELDVIVVSNLVVEQLTQRSADVNNNVQPGTQAKPSAPSEPRTTKPAPVATPPPTTYYPNLTLSALEMQHQKEQELENQNSYWQKRLENLEKSYFKITEILDQEYKKAVDELYIADEKKRANIADSVPPCSESTQKVLKCYQEYPKESLKCSNLVEEFTNCVNQRRARVIAARC